VVRCANRFFQLAPQNRHYAPARGKVLVCEGRHGGIAIEYRGRALRWQEIPAPAQPRVLAQRAPASHAPPAKRKWVPPANHPWRKTACRATERPTGRAPSGAGVATQSALALPCASP